MRVTPPFLQALLPAHTLVLLLNPSISLSLSTPSPAPLPRPARRRSTASLLATACPALPAALAPCARRAGALLDAVLIDRARGRLPCEIDPRRRYDRCSQA